MHRVHRIAKVVLASSDQYPQVVIQYATLIDSWFNERRDAVKFVATNRRMLTSYRVYRKTSNARTILQTRRYATMQLKKMYSDAEMSIWYKFQKHHQSSVSIALECMHFESMLELVAAKNFKLIYECMIATRTGDYTRIDVSKYEEYSVEFEKVRRMNPSIFAEILAWKLYRQH